MKDIILLILILSLSAKIILAQDTWQEANKINFEERVKNSKLNKTFEHDVLLLPNSFHKNINIPLIKLKGEPPVYPLPIDNNKYFWKGVPLKPEHKEYLILRKKFLENNEFDKLIDWCKQKKLDECLEFELRNQLTEIWDFHLTTYQTYRKLWYPLANTQYIEYSFPLPLKGEWFVVEDKTKHHQIKSGAAFAFDLIIKVNGKDFKGNGKNLSDYYSWDQPVYAQADGIVILVKSNSPDIEIGKFGGFDEANYVSINYGNGIAGFYGHLRQNSIKVKVGDKVKVGEIIGYIGNSGASGQPHLHFTLTDQSGISLKGRFDYQVKIDNKWVDASGKDLPEGKFIKEK